LGSRASGGTASAVASGQSTSGGAVNVTASASGGRTYFISGGVGGAAKATATGVAVTGNVQATASANGGASYIPGTAFAKSDAKNSHGEAVTTASAPGGLGGTSPSTLTLAGVGSGNVALPTTFTQGEVISNAVLTPGGQDIGVGAMSVVYGGVGGLQYEATALFDFRTTKLEALDLNLLSANFSNVSGVVFDKLELQVSVDGTPISHAPYIFSSLTGAEYFFTNRSLPLGTFTAGSSPSVSITYDLIYNGFTLAKVGDRFGFTYDLASSAVAATPIATAFDFPVSQSSTVQEPSTWAMMLLGFAGLGFAGWRSRRRSVSIAA
jgi:hypothetical protein